MTEASRHTEGTWELPLEGPNDRAMSERLAATGARLTPQTQWNIDCMVRVIAPELDAHGLLDGPAPWLEMRRSRSEMAGGLTVEFAQHPDEIDPCFVKTRHFRFRPQRVAQSNVALDDLRAASARRAYLMRRRDAIDSGATSEGRALMCDAVLPGLLAWIGCAAAELADHAVEGLRIQYQKGQSLGKTTSMTPMDLERRGQEMVVHHIMLPDGMVYRSSHGAPTLVVRHMTYGDADLAGMPGRLLSDILDHEAFHVDGLTIAAATCRGDTTIFTLARPRGTLLSLP